MLVDLRQSNNNLEFEERVNKFTLKNLIKNKNELQGAYETKTILDDPKISDDDMPFEKKGPTKRMVVHTASHPEFNPSLY